MARYRLVGVLPERLTPISTTSAPRQVGVRLAIVVCQGVVDGLHAVEVFLALADVAESAPTRCWLFRPSFIFQRLHKGAEHVHRASPCSAGLTTATTSGLTRVLKTMDFLPSSLAVVVDLAHRLVGFVGGIDKGNAHDAGVISNCGHQRGAKGLGGDARAVRNHKNRACMHALASPVGSETAGFGHRFGCPALQSPIICQIPASAR